MATKKKAILPIILMADDSSPEGKDAFVLALRDLSKDDIPANAGEKVVFEAGLLVNPIDYLPGFQRRKDKSLRTHELADRVKGLRGQLKAYEKYLRKQKDKGVDVCTLIDYLCKK